MRRRTLIHFSLCLLFSACLSSQVTSNIGCKHYYDQTLGKNIYTEVDVMPEYSEGGNDKFYFSIIESLDFTDIDDLREKASFIFIISDEGEIISYKMKDRITKLIKEQKNYTLFEQKIIAKLCDTKKWIPAKCNGANVCTTLNITFSVPRTSH